MYVGLIIIGEWKLLCGVGCWRLVGSVCKLRLFGGGCVGFASIEAHRVLC